MLISPRKGLWGVETMGRCSVFTSVSLVPPRNNLNGQVRQSDDEFASTCQRTSKIGPTVIIAVISWFLYNERATGNRRTDDLFAAHRNTISPHTNGIAAWFNLEIEFVA